MNSVVNSVLNSVLNSVVNSVVNSVLNSVVNSVMPMGLSRSSPDPPKAAPVPPRTRPVPPKALGTPWEGKVWFHLGERPLWDTAGDPPDPADPLDLVPGPGLGPSLPHAPGARMTVKQGRT